MSGRLGASRRLLPLASCLALGVLMSIPAATAAATTHVNCANSSLQTAINAAPANTTVRVSGTCSGTFYVGKNLTILGSPDATLDGGGGGSTLSISGFRTVRLEHLVITGGKAPDGGGIRMTGGGSLTLDHVRVSGNSAIGGSEPQRASGGGIYVDDPAYLTISNSTISNNHASVSGPNAETADGGGLRARGQVTITNSRVTGNTVSGTSNNNAGIGTGGGVRADGTLAITGSVIQGNRATGTGPTFASAFGAGIYWGAGNGHTLRLSQAIVSKNVAEATTPGDARTAGGGLYFNSSSDPAPVTITRSTFDGNRTLATSSGGDATVDGGAIYGDAKYGDASASLTRTVIRNSLAVASGAHAADGHGGALMFRGNATLARVTLAANELRIHAGTGLALGGGGAAYLTATSTIRVSNSAVAGNAVNGTSDGPAAGVQGGGILARGAGPIVIRGSTISKNTSTATANGGTSESYGGGLSLIGSSAGPGDSLINTTVTLNKAVAVAASGPTAAGGGLYVENKKLVLSFNTIARNDTPATGSGAWSGGGGIYLETGTSNRLFANIIALNHGTHGPDCLGSASSDGFNLFSDKTGCSLNVVIGDQVSATPKLGLLAANGGPTKTIGLQAGSPALNQVSAQGCHTAVTRDQRGVIRPQGPKCDIGAFEKTT